MTDPVSVDAHLERVLSSIKPLGVYSQPLLDAFGVPAAEDVTAPIPLPAFDNSAMDGYAVVFRDVADAREEAPIHLPVVGEIGAGQARLVAMSPGTAVKIMTGAPIPQGCTAVVPYEWTDRGVATVRINRAPVEGQHIRHSGEDVEVGDVLISAGTVLGPRHVGLLAGVGLAGVKCRARPRVVVMSTGSELRDPGVPLGHDSIYDSNSWMLAAAVRAAGGIAYRVGVGLGRARGLQGGPRRPARPRRHRGHQRGCQPGRLRRGQGVARRPRHRLVRRRRHAAGQAAGLRRDRRRRTPRSSRCRATRCRRTSPSRCSSSPPSARCRAATPHARPPRSARLTHGLSSPKGKQQYVRATYDSSLVTPVGGHGSHLIGDLASSDALIVVPEDVTMLASGDTVQVMLLDEEF